MSIYNVNPTELIEELAKELQKVETVKAPSWASFVKTGASRERPPARQDWWQVRAASVLRKVSSRGPIGISKLRILYGGKKNRGHQPEKFMRSSGNILRKILQQLEKAELVKQDKKGVHKGRVITPKGIKLMNGVAKKICDNQPKKEVPKPVEKKVEATEKKVETKPTETKAKPVEKTEVKPTEKKVEAKPAEIKDVPKEKPVERVDEKPKKDEVKPTEAKEKPIEKAKDIPKVPTAAELAEKNKK
jgi:small subunit ribosomal protein S19e